MKTMYAISLGLLAACIALAIISGGHMLVSEMPEWRTMFVVSAVLIPFLSLATNYFGKKSGL